MAIFETFIINDPNEITEGVEALIQVRDAETYEERIVKAIVSRSPEKLPGADALRVRWQRGQSLPELWAIKILEDMGSVMDQPKGKFLIE
jgi:hypothetical protein